VTTESLTAGRFVPSEIIVRLLLQKDESGDEGFVNKRGSAVKPRMIMGLEGLLMFEPAERRNELVNKQ
jgi:hypothetical protein